MIAATHPETGEPTELPTRWGELSLAQAQYVLAADASLDTYGVLGILFTPRASRESIMNAPLAQAEALVAAAAFLATPCPTFEGLPAAVTLRDLDGARVEVEVPTALALKSFGQACDLGASIEAMAEDVPALRVRVLAIYLMPALCGAKLPARYDTDLLGAVERLVGALPLELAVPIADFFLPISRPQPPPTAPTYSSGPSASTSNGPASPSSGPGGTITRWPRVWRAGINYLSRKFTAGRGPR